MSADRDTIEAVLNGERERYADLVERYAERSHAVAYSYLGDARDAEDVTQEALLKAYRKLRTLAVPDSFGAWLCQITRNLCKGRLRKKRLRTEPLEEQAQSPDRNQRDVRQSLSDRQIGEVIRESLENLPPKMREAMALYYIKDESIAQIAEFLGIPENTVKQRLHAGRQRMRKDLESIVEEGVGEVRLSDGFLPAVMLALPTEPAKAGIASLLVLKLFNVSWFWALAIAGAFAVATHIAIAHMVTRFIMAGETRETQRWFRWLSYRTWLIGAGGIAGALSLMFLSSDFPWFSLVGGTVLLIGVLSLARCFTILGWKARICLVSLVLFFGIMVVGPVAPLIGDAARTIWIVSFFMFFITLPVPVMSRRVMTAMRKTPEEWLEEAPDIEPVTVEYLHDNARKFVCNLNTPVPVFLSLRKSPEGIRLGNGRILRVFARVMGLAKAGGLYSAEMDPGGNVTFNIEEPPGGLLQRLDPEKIRSDAATMMRVKWAYFLAGRSKEAPPLAFNPRRDSNSERQIRLMHRARIAWLVSVTLMFGVMWLPQLMFPGSASKPLSANRLESFYRDEFLPSYRSGKVTAAEPRLMLYFKQPSLVNEMPEVRDAFIALQRENYERYPNGSLAVREIYNGLESGYLTVEMLRDWGVTPDDFALNLDDPQNYIRPSLLDDSRHTRPDIPMRSAYLVLLLQRFDALEAVDPRLPDELVARLDYADGAFSLINDNAILKCYVETTAWMAVILSAMDRWDLSDREAVRNRLIEWGRKGLPRAGEISPDRVDQTFQMGNPDEYYAVAQALIALDATDEAPLSRLAKRIHPTDRKLSDDALWSVDSYEINAFAIKEILKEESRRQSSSQVHQPQS